jgi:alpha-galactosidase
MFGDSSESEYLPGDECSSENDDEVQEIQTKFREFKRRLKAGQVANLDEVILDSPKEMPNLYEIEDEGNLTPYDGSSDDDDSIEELSDGDIQKCTSKCPRFNKKEPIPKFEVRMKFSGKKQFKKACIMHSLVERRLIKFFKNEASRMIAVCDWSTCK